MKVELTVTPERMTTELESTLRWNAGQMAYHEAKLACYWLMHCQGQPTRINLKWHARKRAEHRATMIAACEILDADI